MFFISVLIFVIVLFFYIHYKPLQKNNDMDIYEADYVSNKTFKKSAI
jgi:hypothetical protein